MIQLRLGPDDLARIRFALSPLEELVHSVPVLTGSGQHMVHRPWRAKALSAVAGIDLRVLADLTRGPRFVADFLAVPPEAMTGRFGDELDALASTPADDVVRSLEELRTGQGLPESLRPLHEHPERELSRLVATMTLYWRAAIEPVWPRLRSLGDADVAHRARQLTSGGLDRVFADLHPEVTYTSGVLNIDKPHHNAVRAASGAGLLLVPCVFAWPRLLVLHNAPQQPTLTYSPRGIGQLWSARDDARSQPLAELMGRSRAALLVHLDLPVSTTQLAAYLGVSSAAVSQHLAVLRRCGLVTSHRSGRWMLHQRTALATELLQPAEEPKSR